MLGQGYLAQVVAVLQAARLSRAWPDVRLLVSHLGGMATLGPLKVGPMGLPTWSIWSQLVSDQAAAGSILAGLPDLETLRAQAATDSADVHRRRLQRREYLEALQGRPLAPLGRVEGRVRRQTADGQEVQLVLDKLDASGVFVRITVDLSQSRDQVPLARLDLKPDTEVDPVRTVIYRSSAVPAELLFIQLADMPDLVVHRVAKGTIGPIELDRGAVGHFAFDVAERRAEANRWNDPINQPLSSLAEVRAQRGYRVLTDRKFVVTADRRAEVLACCEAAGTRNVIYPVILPT